MGKKIYINAGHSNTDPGAVGYETERVLNVKVSNFMEKYLLANYDCETKQSDGSTGSLVAITNDANRWGADLFVSNHFNAAGGDGYEALVYSQARVPLGQIFEKHVKAIGQNSRGVKLRPELGVLKWTDMPAVLNEGAFVDNLKDIQDWNDDDELQKMGIAYAKAAAEYLGLTAKKTTNKTEETQKPATANVKYRVQVGVYSNYNKALAMVNKLKAAKFNALIVTVNDENTTTEQTKGDDKPNAGQAKKSIDEIAKEVISGKWGNGAERKQKITAAGYDYSAVQKRVNELLKG